MAIQDFLGSFISQEILDYQIGQNIMMDYIHALAVFLLSLIILRIFKFIIIKKLCGLAKKTKTTCDDLLVKIIDRIGWPFYFFLSLYLAIQFIVIPDIISTAAYAIVLILAGYHIIRSAGYVIDYGAEALVVSKKEKGERIDKSVVNMLATVSKVAMWAVVIILIISNLGYDTSALLTGLGIGGIAVALALQTVLSDIFAYFSIHLDKPFRVGDFIVIGTDMGTVEKIGIKTTRIRTLQGQELVISNQELTGTRINNYKRMEKRRITFNFGISYDTPASKIEQVPLLVKKTIEGMEHAQFDRAHFRNFSDSSLVFEVVYYMTTPDYNTYMDTQQAINIAIKKSLDKERIEIPYPTQTIQLSKRS